MLSNLWFHVYRLQSKITNYLLNIMVSIFKFNFLQTIGGPSTCAVIEFCIIIFNEVSLKLWRVALFAAFILNPDLALYSCF